MTATDCPPLADRITKSLLGYGVIAGPCYVVSVTAQTATRADFDPLRDSASQLANGPRGWIQVVTFLLTGAMTVAAAVGFRRALGDRRRAGWTAALLGGYGVGLMAAGVFRADPAGGPASWHGVAHLAVAALGFLCVGGACLTLGGWPSRLVGLFFLVAFVMLASGRGGTAAVVTFTVAVIAVWGWLAAVSVSLYRAVEP